MNWFRVSLPTKLLQRNEIAVIGAEFDDVISTIYNNDDVSEVVLLCDDPTFKNGAVYASPEIMKFPLLNQYINSFDPVRCDINSVEHLFYLAGNKLYAQNIISKSNSQFHLP